MVQFLAQYFLIYKYSLPETISDADDLYFAIQNKEFDAKEHILENLPALENYFKKWQLKPNPSKIVVCIFHLKNRIAN